MGTKVPDNKGKTSGSRVVFKEEGIEPHKSYSGSLNVRLTPDIHTRVAYLAKKTGVSINSFIRTAVEKQIAGML